MKKKNEKLQKTKLKKKCNEVDKIIVCRQLKM